MRIESSLLSPLVTSSPLQHGVGGNGPHEDDNHYSDQRIIRSPPPAIVHIILLLVDQVTRQFELLQLKFLDPNETLVADVLQQIPTSVQQSGIRSQRYLGVCNPFVMGAARPFMGGQEQQQPEQQQQLLNSEAYLSDLMIPLGYEDPHDDDGGITKSNSTAFLFLIALPQGLTVETCVQQGRLIYRHIRVIQLLQDSGIPLPPVLTAHQPATTMTTVRVEEDEDEDQPHSSNKENHHHHHHHHSIMTHHHCRQEDQQETSSMSVVGGGTMGGVVSPSFSLPITSSATNPSSIITGTSIIAGSATSLLSGIPPPPRTSNSRESQYSPPKEDENVSSRPPPSSRWSVEIQVQQTPIRSNRKKPMTPVTKSTPTKLPSFRRHSSSTTENDKVKSLKHGPSPSSVMELSSDMVGTATIAARTTNGETAEEEKEDYMSPPSFPPFGFQDDMMMSMVLQQTQLENQVAERLSKTVPKEKNHRLDNWEGDVVRHGHLRHDARAAAAAAAVAAAAVPHNMVTSNVPPDTLDYKSVEVDILKFIHEDLYKKGPAVIRLASHSAVTYKKLVAKRNFGSNSSGSMRSIFSAISNSQNNLSSSSIGNNNGNGSSASTNNLQRRRSSASARRTRTFPEELRSTQNGGCMGATELTVAKWMEPIRQKYASVGLSYADFYTLAGVIAIQKLGGPAIPWEGGRVDGDRVTGDLDQGGDVPRIENDAKLRDNDSDFSFSKVTGAMNDNGQVTSPVTSPHSTPTNTNAARMARLEHIKMRLERKKQQVVERQQQQLQLQYQQELRPQTGPKTLMAGNPAANTGHSPGGGSAEFVTANGGAGNSDGAADWLGTLNDPIAGLSDAEIVALCGANAMDRCCRRSRNGHIRVLDKHTFDNTFFVILSNLTSIPSQWDGAFQFVNVKKGSLCLKMIPSDITLLQEERFSKWVQLYCKNCQKFLEHVRSAFIKLDQEPKEISDEEDSSKQMVSIGSDSSVCSSSNSTTSISDESGKPKVQLVLLLMSTVCFELVRTEVYAETARVCDVLALIPQLADQESIRRQSYIGLCDYRNDEALYSQTLISEVCSETLDAINVVVALPNDLFVRECGKRARQILRQVIPQLESGGMDVSHWLESA